LTNLSCKRTATYKMLLFATTS